MFCFQNRKSGENPAQFRYGIYGVKAYYVTERIFSGRRTEVKMYKSGYRLNTGCSNSRERMMHIKRTQKYSCCSFCLRTHQPVHATGIFCFAYYMKLQINFKTQFQNCLYVNMLKGDLCMNTGKLYGVGVGPGDKELITLKAVRIISECSVIAVPLMKNGSRTAYEIAEEYTKGKKIIEIQMPMSKKFDELEKNYEAAADIIEAELKQSNSVAFLTLGDPTVYSTYMRLDRIIRGRGHETEIVPGITSFCAAAARINMPLCERDETLIVLPASYDIDNSLEIKGTKVLMKSSRGIDGVIDKLKEKQLLERSVIVENCGMANERIIHPSEGEKPDNGYFSIVFVK